MLCLFKSRYPFNDFTLEIECLGNHVYILAYISIWVFKSLQMHFYIMSKPLLFALNVGKNDANSPSNVNNQWNENTLKEWSLKPRWLSWMLDDITSVVGYFMMTSSNGNIFRVTSHLCGEFGEFPAERPVTRSFDVFVDLRLNKRLSKQSCGWWFETLSRPLWRHCELN